MNLGELLTEEREFILRSLALTGVKVIVPLSNDQGRFKLSGTELEDQEIQEIHILDSSYPGIEEKLSEIGFEKKGNIDKWVIYVSPERVLNESGFSGSFEVGDLVINNIGVEVGCKGYVCYKSIIKKTIFLLLEDGTLIDWIGESNQIENLIFIKKTGYVYPFHSIAQIKKDFANELFNRVFK